MPLPDEFVALAAEVNNWGRWGEDDERGTLNLIDDAAVLRGVASVVTGERFLLAIPLGEDGVQAGLIPGRDNPVHTMTAIHQPMFEGAAFDMNDDHLAMGAQVATHWDALAHVSYGGRVYNGMPPETIDDRGAHWAGIDKAGTIVSRGVLLDLPRTLGVEELEPGHHVTPEDLDAACEHAGVDVQPGDIVLLRTGQIRRFHQGDRVGYAFPSPGPVMRTARWFRAKDVAAVAIDTLAFEAFPGDPADLVLPVHPLHLVEMGLTQGQNWDLEALAEACAADGRHTFLLEATPEPIVRGLGAPVAPVAIR